MREKIQRAILQYISASKAQMIHSHDDVFLTDKILALISEEIEKGLLTDEEIRVGLKRVPISYSELVDGRLIAQAQLQKILALLK